MFAWTSAGQPTAAECADLISTQGVVALKPALGEVLCVGTGQGNIAILIVKRVDIGSGGNISDILAQATIWSND